MSIVLVCDAICRVRSVHEAVELVAGHSRFASAAFEMRDEGGWGGENFRAARGQETAKLAQGLVLVCAWRFGKVRSQASQRRLASSTRANAAAALLAEACCSAMRTGS